MEPTPSFGGVAIHLGEASVLFVMSQRVDFRNSLLLGSRSENCGDFMRHMGPLKGFEVVDQTVLPDKSGG